MVQNNAGDSGRSFSIKLTTYVFLIIYVLNFTGNFVDFLELRSLVKYSMRTDYTKLNLNEYF